MMDVEVAKAPQPFDYTSIDGGKADRARAAADFITTRQASVVAAMLQIGAKLLEVKEDLEHGQFVRWVESEIRWSPRTAQRYMSAAQIFAGKSDIVSYLPIGTVYMLASASEPIREEVVKRIEAERLPAEKINAMVSDARRERLVSRMEAQASARKTDQQLRRSKAYREKQRRLAEIERQQREAQRLKEEAAASKVALMIIERFGDDLPELLELAEEAGRYCRDMCQWLRSPYGWEDEYPFRPKTAPQTDVGNEGGETS